MRAESEPTKDRRAQVVALGGLILQALLFALLLIVGSAYESPAVWAEAIHLQFGIYVWLGVALLYGQRRRAGVEHLETEQLKRSREESQQVGIFDAEDDRMLVQRRRLNWMYRWFVPGVALLLGLGHLCWAGAWYVRALPVRDEGWPRCSDPQRVLWFVVAATFFSFLYSRYAAGMARRPEWRLLRSASGYLAGNALMSLICVVGLALLVYDVPYAGPIVTYVIRVSVAVLGVEFLVNFVLDFYRPRTAGVEPRPAFDSRLLGLISEPGGIARSIQDAINYQFGFEVSRTWFYQLLKRSLLPLAVFAMLVLVGLSSLVVVDADERAFVEHWGRIADPAAPLEPGLHVKYPWPVDRVRFQPVRRLRRMTVGEAKKERDPATEAEPKKDAVLWTDEHDYLPEVMLLVASPRSAEQERAGRSARPSAGTDGSDDSAGRAVAVSLIMASVQMEYRIRDLFPYEYNYVDPEQVMENVAYQMLADYASQIDVTRFMGPERERIGRELRTLLQRRFDDLELGVELTFVGLQNAHPPSKDDVAKTFQDVIAAKSRKEALIEAAKGAAQRTLTEAAGSRERAVELDAAIQAMDRLSTGPGGSAGTLAEAAARVDELMLGNVVKGIAPMSGEAAATIADARGEMSRLTSEAESKARTFENELVAYQSAPRLYQTRRYLEVLRNSLHRVRKFIDTTENAGLVVVIESEKQSEFKLPEPDDAG